MKEYMLLIRNRIGHDADWTSEKIQVGYYHIMAKDFDEAMEIAKRNPEFEFSTTARIEVRPIKTKENTTGFVYPENKKP